MSDSKRKLQDLTNKVTEDANALSSALKIMVNGSGKAETYINGIHLEEVNNFKHLGARAGRCTANTRIRIPTVTAIMSKLNKTWSSNSIRFSSK